MYDFGISIVNVKNVILIGSSLLYDLGTIIFIICCEFADIETSNFNLTHWILLLRDIRSFGSLWLKIKFLGACNFKKSQSFAEIDRFIFLFHFTFDGCQVEIMSPESNLIFPS